MALRNDEIVFLVEGFTSGEIPRYQLSAFLMAVCLQGMSEKEPLSLTHKCSRARSCSIFPTSRMPRSA